MVGCTGEGGTKPLPGLGDEDFPGFPADKCPLQLPDLSRHHSTLVDVLKEEPFIYDRLRSRETTLGVGLARCIKVGMDNRGHHLVRGLGMVGGDSECFDTFRELFDRVIQRHLGDAPAAGICLSHPTDLDRFGLRLTALQADPSGTYVLSSHVRMWRNLDGFRFPPAMSRLERHEVERLVTQALMGVRLLSIGEYLPLQGSGSYTPRVGGMSSVDEKALQDAGLLFEAPDSTWRLCTGAGRHWPEGRGVFVNSERTLAVWVNEQEHLRVTSLHPGGSIQLAFREAVRTVDAIADELHRKGHVRGGQAYAHSSRLGFLTSNLANLGTGMQVSVTVQLPLLARNKTSNWQDWCSVQRVQVRSTCAEAGGVQLSGIFELSNYDRLGVSEVDTVNLLVHVASRLVQMERRLEIGQPIDSLVASVQLMAVSQAPLVCTTTSDEVCKARAGLLLGLKTGQVLRALEATGQQAGSFGQAALTAALPSDAVAFGIRSEETVAELFVSGMLQSIVEDPEGPLASRSESTFTAEALRSVQGSDGSRPVTGDSMMTVFASSDPSVNEVAAAEIIEDLIDAEIDVRIQAEDASSSGCAQETMPVSIVTTTPSKAQIIETKREVADLLTKACLSGKLASTLDTLEEPASKPSIGDDHIPLEILRQRVRESLLGALDSGTLDGCMQDASVKKTSDETSAGGLDMLRMEMATVLASALHSGELETILEDMNGDAGVEIDRLKMKTADTLYSACQSGELSSILFSIREGYHATTGQHEEEVEVGIEVVEEEDDEVAAVASLPTLPVVAALSAQRKSPLFSVLQLLSRHNQRLGELTALIEITRRHITERVESCEKLEEAIAAAKAEISHLELDIEWHRRAWEAAEERNAELELYQRKLLGGFDLYQKHLDGGPSIMSARSEMSTMTGFSAGSASMSTCSYAQRWGHPLLEPVAQRQ
mmetsp:Transcript_137897/g.384544  ORF Transcript_137897/g.384544 Transcript_137897/m.384544 type:complete len:940 (-) Transcript_137897:333-3152(-)|eukprot:CAMPEP_0179041858 /NCGR_PEP_ID=MMETSP0796-20121207/16370_1 /TAXON_ID=73915 /ORGANISM="Pyrodinium bahamense, Strain pbaha01" /LENGTH=939 /DNA_ID=CAMNT_0020738229 /DNA_START=51 /DNA_END=2870 /DNA_ORIENTATION=-